MSFLPTHRDNRNELRRFANFQALYQPDTLKYAQIGGRGYIFTSNEGDSKEEGMSVSAHWLESARCLCVSSINLRHVMPQSI